MSKKQPPKIEFPCEGYPIKVLGTAGEEFHTFVMTVMERHAPGFDQTRVTIKESREGRFQSITVVITATGEPQLRAIFEELKNNRLIKMVL